MHIPLTVWIYALLSVALVSAVSLAGIFTLFLKSGRLKKVLLYLVSFSVGALFGDVFIHLLPEIFEKPGGKFSASLFIILGILIFFILEKFLRWRHCHIPTSRDHPHPVVTLNLVGDGFHNLLDGIIIAGSYTVSLAIGLTTTLAVILHEIPQEMGDFGVLIHGGLSVRRALFFNFFSALLAVLGALLYILIGSHLQGLANYVLPITAGGFIYIAGSDLIPELHHQGEGRISSSLGQLFCILLGIAVMALLVFLD
jgi:zinc and cadmium transporter